MSQVKIDIKIMGVEKRLPLIKEILRKAGIPDSCVVLDDRGFEGGGDAWYTAKKAWTAPLPEGCTHRLVIQDDIDVVNNFVTLVNKVVTKFPNVAWTFNGGTWTTNNMKKNNSPYIRLKGCRASAQALLLPVEHIQPMINWSDDMFGVDYKHDDGRISWYCCANGIPMYSTIPSLVSHIQVDSCIPHHNRKDRITKTWVGVNVDNENWNSIYVADTPLILKQIWLPKDDPRWPRINAMINKAKARLKLNLYTK